MGFIIIGIILLVIGMLIKLFDKYDRYYVTKAVIIYAGTICLLVSILCSIVCCFDYKVEYAQLIQDKQIIEYCLEQAETEKSVMVIGGVYSDAMEYNKAIRPHKEYINSFWLGIFLSKDIAELNYIEVQ